MMNLHTLDLSACLPRGAWRRQAVPTQADTIHPGKIRALFGLTPVALSQLLEAVLPVMMERRQQAQASRPDRKRRVGGGRKRRLRPYQEVLMSLLYLRHNVSHAVVGQLFGVSADTSENTFHEVVPILQAVCPSQRFNGEKKWKKSEPSWHPDEVDRVLIDSFETPIRRPSPDHRQRQVYSGKRKRHTIKTQVATDLPVQTCLQRTCLRAARKQAGHRGPKADICGLLISAFGVIFYAFNHQFSPICEALVGCCEQDFLEPTDYCYETKPDCPVSGLLSYLYFLSPAQVSRAFIMGHVGFSDFNPALSGHWVSHHIQYGLRVLVCYHQ